MKNKFYSRQRRWFCGVVFQFPERYFIEGKSIGEELKIGHKSLREKNIEIILNSWFEKLIDQPLEQLSVDNKG